MSFSLPGYPLAKHIQSGVISNGGCPKTKLGDSFTIRASAPLQINILIKVANESFMKPLNRRGTSPIEES
jgi:hypothetical protein